MNFTNYLVNANMTKNRNQGEEPMPKYTTEDIEILMKEFVSHTIDFYDDLETRPVYHSTPSDILEKIRHQSIPVKGRSVQSVYTEMLEEIYANTLLAQHPRSFACIPSTASLLSWMGDVMTNAYNPHASCQNNAPACDLVEKKLIRWLCDLAGYPKESSGLFVSGGSVANLTALCAARDDKLSPDQRTNAIVYVSDQTHSSVIKGLYMIGFLKEQIRIIPTDSSFSMDVAILENSIEQDIALQRKPFAIIASAGTTNTGSVDPLLDISILCKKYDLWMHVDGAFGASALVSREQRKKLAGIEFSDSLSWDAHKWLLQTYGCSMVLVRNQTCLIRSFMAHPEYLKDAQTYDGSIEFWDLGPELTRPARGLKLWLTLQVLGIEEIERIIDHGCALAKLVEQIIQKKTGWEIISPAQLGIINFRYISDKALSQTKLDEINQTIAKEITDSGFAQIYTTQIQEKIVLRMCTIHPETTEQDIYDTLNRLMQIADKLIN